MIAAHRQPVLTLWGALLVLALASLSSAQTPAPSATPASGDEIVESLEVGFDGWIPAEGVAGMWLVLKNPRATMLRLRVVARGRHSRTERIVEVPPGSRRRVDLALAVSYRMSIEVYEGEALLFRQEVDNAPRMNAGSHLVVIDGLPPQQRKGEATQGDRTLQVTSIRPETAPREAAGYTALGTVLLRDLDPTVLDPDQREALIEFGLGGGTLYLVGAGPSRLKLIEFLRQFPGQDTKVKVFGQTALRRDFGLGHVVTFGDDFIPDLVRLDQRAVRLGEEVSRALQQQQGRSRIGPTYERFGGDADHPGATSFAMVVVCFGLYWLVVGPGIAIGLRKARRRRLALFTLGAIAAFCGLAFVVAGFVRTATGAVHVREVVYVPADGPAFGVADVTLVSGGAWRYDLHLQSDRPFAATQSDEAGRRDFESQWRHETFEPSAVRTQRGKELELDVRAAPWDQRSVHVVQVRRDLRALDAEVTGGSARGRGYEVRVKNTTGAPFGPAILIEDVASQIGLSTNFVDLGVLQPGEEKTVALRPGTRIRGANLPSYRGRHWFSNLEVPSTWTGWAALLPDEQSRLNVRFAILSPLPNSIRASGSSLDVHAAALRIDRVRLGAVFERGYVGVELESGAQQFGMATNTVVVSRVLNGGPAALAGVKAGDVVLSISGANGQISIKTPEEFQNEVARHRPGQRIAITLRRANGSIQNLTIRLVRREDIAGR